MNIFVVTARSEPVSNRGRLASCSVSAVDFKPNIPSTVLLGVIFASIIVVGRTTGATAQEVEDQVAEIVSEATEERIEQAMEDLLDDIESRISEDSLRIQTDHWLVMAEADVFVQLEEEGYLFDRVSELEGLGFLLAEVAAPASFDLSATRSGIYEVIGGDRADVDLNHLYTAGVPDRSDASGDLAGLAPRELLSLPTDLSDLSLRIGIIDSSVDHTHDAFADASITTRRFVDNDAPPDFHGTAIASIIAGNDPFALGLAPRADLFAAEVFDETVEQGEFASTVSLIKALNWLVTQQVSVINISLAGPPNRLLETALARVRERGMIAIAAAGNGGPMAQPMYPAAYPQVVAVTATDARGRAFRLANRGEYVDIAAPWYPRLSENMQLRIEISLSANTPPPRHGERSSPVGSSMRVAPPMIWNPSSTV